METIDTHDNPPADTPLALDSSAGLDFTVTAARFENGTPVGYRLARAPWGELTLQGAYQWQQGSDGGIEWRGIPTVQL